MWKRKMEERTDFNYMIQNKKAFRNPSIYEKLILHLNIDELGEQFCPALIYQSRSQIFYYISTYCLNRISQINKVGTE